MKIISEDLKFTWARAPRSLEAAEGTRKTYSRWSLEEIEDDIKKELGSNYSIGYEELRDLSASGPPDSLHGIDL